MSGTETATASAATRSTLIDALGGRRGVVDGGLPPVLFVGVNAIAGAHTTRPHALAAAIGAALGTALVIVGLRLIRKGPLRQALGGLAGLVVAVVFAARSGEARGFFLPGIYVDAAYAVVLAGSALIGRPLAGIGYGLLYGRRGQWREDGRLRRVFTIATLLWSLIFAARALVQAVLYAADRPGMLAAAKLLLGWPLTFLAVAVTLALVRRAARGRTRQDGAAIPAT